MSLAQALADLAARGETMTYGALARRLHGDAPGAMARLTAALEETMAQDAAAGLPLRAALCEGRLSGGLPARGFFDLAAHLGRFGPGQDPAAFVAAERAALFKRAVAD